MITRGLVNTCQIFLEKLFENYELLKSFSALPHIMLATVTRELVFLVVYALARVILSVTAIAKKVLNEL